MKVIIIALMGLCATSAYHEGGSIRRANSKFADDFAGKLMENGDDNVVFSPFSAHSALSMLYQGAGGTTKAALAAALYLPDAAETAQAYETVLNDLNSDSQQIEVKVANKVYATPGHTLKPDFDNALKNYFHSDVQTLDFAQNVAAAKEINSWVEANTNNKIHDLLQPHDLTVDTHLVLVNALYFKGSWLYPFDKQFTQPGDFHVDAKTTLKVPTMTTTGYFLHVKDASFGAELVGLPFQNKNYIFWIINPLGNIDINTLSKLSIKDAVDLAQEAEITDIELRLPKFKISRTINMKEVLGKLGLSELFDSGTCDLTNMFTNSEDLYVSKAVQKTYVDVNEDGVEAAAATGIVATGRSLPYSVTVDHPFLFAIVHRSGQRSTDILLMGRIVNPADGN